jgi:membrane protein involved in colicin uptake
MWAEAPQTLGVASQASSAQSVRMSQYTLAIQQAVFRNWMRPDNFPEIECKVRISQSVGGKVMDAELESDCPYDERSKISVRNAVLRTFVLPYSGFEDVFQPTVVITFSPAGG